MAMIRFATVAALSLFAACNARGFDFADFDRLPRLERDLNHNWSGKVTVTKFHNNKVTNGVTRCWLEFHVSSVGGAIPDATNMTLVCCETIQPIFRGDDDKWEKLTDYERERYSQLKILTPWHEVPEAKFFKLREECGWMCHLCGSGVLPKRHAFFSATVDTDDSMEDYGDFSHGFLFYVVCEFEAEE